MSICIEGDKEEIIEWLCECFPNWKRDGDHAYKRGTVIYFTQRGHEVIITTLFCGWYRESKLQKLFNFY